MTPFYFVCTLGTPRHAVLLLWTHAGWLEVSTALTPTENARAVELLGGGE